MTQVRQEEMQEVTTSATAMMLPEHMTLVLTLPTVHLGGQVPTRNCPLTSHMHLTLQTHTRQWRAFTNNDITPPLGSRLSRLGLMDKHHVVVVSQGRQQPLHHEQRVHAFRHHGFGAQNLLRWDARVERGCDEDPGRRVHHGGDEARHGES